MPTAWSCTASAGSSCTASPPANVGASRSGSVSLLSGGTATYTLVGNVPLIAPLGNSTNSVTIASAIDPNPANNTLADTDNIVRVLPISFTGASDAASLNPLATTLAFGNENGASFSVVTLTMGGNAPVTFQTATVTSSNTTTGFTKGADTCSGTTKNPGDTCTIRVNFNGPSGNNSRTGTLSVPYTGATGSPRTLALTGS